MSRIQQKQNEKKEYLYYLPDNEDGVELKTDINSLIFIGGNGAGKSRLGAWIEEKLGEKCHRIAGQRNLNFNPSLTIRPLPDARAQLEYMHDYEYFQQNPFVDKKLFRWLNNKKVTTLLNDFDNALSALIALKNSEMENLYAERNKAESDEEYGKRVRSHIGVEEKLKEIWAEVLPQRNITIEDNRFYCCPKDNEEEKYSATEMSDGERSVLYLIAQVLSISEGKTIIVDEPELHLHPSIMHKLWTTLEEYRKDCLFIYITHDVGFTALHSQSKKYWIKSFKIMKDESSGISRGIWDYKEIENQNDFPEELLIEILGGRKNVLFVEGEKQSYDTRLYQAFYPEFLVIPCGGCSKVIERTKTLNNITIFNQSYKAYGIIDRDFRTENELKSLEDDQIFSLNVAEVENLFLLEDVVTYMVKRFKPEKDTDLFISEIKNFVIATKYEHAKNKQKQKAVKQEIEYRLSRIDIDENNINLDTLQQKVHDIDYEQILADVNKKFDVQNYEEVLKVFNDKGLLQSVIRRHFGWNSRDKEAEDAEYIAKIFAELKTQESPLRDIFLKNMPKLHQSS